MADIIVVEDDKEIGELLMDFLVAEWYDTYLAASGEEALLVYEDEGAKLLILDIMLPGIDGLAVLSSIREIGNAPVIIVSAKNTKEDKLDGLNLGADDYVEKPYDIDILLAKIKGIFKRRYSMEKLIDDNITVDKTARKIYLDGNEVAVTVKEYELLVYLMKNKGKVIKKEELFNAIWGFDSESEPQTLTVHIKFLREKFEKDPKNPTRILTVWGVGYRFE